MPAALCLLLSAALALAPVQLAPAQEARAKQLGNNLRCPICTGLPITESPNDLSLQMLREVREQVAAGRTDRDIYAYFAARYGNFVLLDPPKEGGNLVLWGAPLAALAAGGAALWAFLRRRPGAAADPPSTHEEAFDPFLAQVQRDTRQAETERGGPDAGGSA